MEFGSDEEDVEGPNTTPDDQPTTDEALTSVEEEAVQAESDHPASMDLPSPHSTHIPEQIELPGPSGVQPSRSTPEHPRRMSGPGRRPSERPTFRRRLRPEQDLNQEIIALIHRQRTEDGSDAFGRAIADRLRTMPIPTRTTCMSFMLGCMELFLEPYVPPPVATLLSNMMQHCRASPAATGSGERAMRDSMTQTEWQHEEWNPYVPRLPGYFGTDTTQYSGREAPFSYGVHSHVPHHPPPHFAPNNPMHPQQQHSATYSDFTASLRSPTH